MLVTPWGEALIRRWYRDGLDRALAPAAGHALRGPDQLVGAARLGRARESPNGSRCGARTTRSGRPKRSSSRSASTLDESRHPLLGRRRRPARARGRCALAPRRAARCDVRVDQRGQGARRTRADEVAIWRSIDPLFELNNQRYPSLGKRVRCRRARDHRRRRRHDATLSLHQPIRSATSTTPTGRPRSHRARARSSIATATSVTSTSITSSSAKSSRPAFSSACRRRKRAPGGVRLPVVTG